MAAPVFLSCSLLNPQHLSSKTIAATEKTTFILSLPYSTTNPPANLPDGCSELFSVVTSSREGKTATLVCRPTSKAGSITIGDTREKITLTFVPCGDDIDEDGFPDEAELTGDDARRFRAWFVRIAEGQLVKTGGAWNTNERDCAGLIRYAYREALKSHDSRWFSQSGIAIDKNLPDVEAFSYPDIPGIGLRLFRIGEGGAPEAFGDFADARTLARYNTRFVSKSLDEAAQGDILFFHIERSDTYHSVIVADRGGGMLIYHTGEGSMKRVTPEYLSGSADFAPIETNPSFLGVYRFLILE